MKFQLYVPDVDAGIARAVDAGVLLVWPSRHEFYSDRTATVTDPFGYFWQLASRIETVAPSEMQARWDRAMAGQT